MTTNELSFMVGGAAGLGIKTGGLIFARLCSRAGVRVFGNVEYPSIIRGDHNSYQVMVSEKRVFGHVRTLDILLALDDLSIELVLSKNSIAPEGRATSAQDGGRSRFARGAQRSLRARLARDCR